MFRTDGPDLIAEDGLRETLDSERVAEGVAWVRNLPGDKSTHFVVRREDGEMTDLFLVIAPGVCDNGFYRQAMSMGAFRRKMLMRVVKRIVGPDGAERVIPRPDVSPRYSVKFDPTEIECDIKSDGRLIAKGIDVRMIHEIPRTEFSDVWSFYEAIGWDYKKQRFT